MLQVNDYNIRPFVAWFARLKNPRDAMRRKQLVKTSKTKALLRFGYVLYLLLLVVVISLVITAFYQKSILAMLGAALLAAAIPYALITGYVVLVYVAAIVLQKKNKAKFTQAREIYQKHTGYKIAILGSYGKTSMKEYLLHVLSAGLEVAATPQNKNALISVAHLASKLTNEEEMIIIEFGEEQPGDIAKFASLTSPTHAVVTGAAPVHMETYKNLQTLIDDIASIKSFVRTNQIYYNAENTILTSNLTDCMQYSSTSVLGWKIDNTKISIEGTSFRMKKGTDAISISVPQIGRHNIGPIAFVVAFALSLGIPTSAITNALTKLKVYEHRMKPRNVNGAWIIDDTYNGNIEGIKAGCALLKELPAKRKIYVTPGLVEQGAEAKQLHITMGGIIADAHADIVVLMNNSTTAWIRAGLEQAGYTGQVKVEDNPQQYYLNLEHHIAAGDIVLLQNDWTDNYA